MEKAFNMKAVLVAVILGLGLVYGLTIFTGGKFGTPVLPFMAMLSGFIVTGLLVGLISKGETVAEPGVASILVGILAYFLIINANLQCLQLLPGNTASTNLILVIMNGILLTFAGAWAGEKLQGTYDKGTAVEGGIEWGWIIAGTLLGITISMLVANLILIAFPASGLYLFLALIAGLLITGYIVGLKSPGVTMKEAGFAGLAATIINLDIFKFCMDPDTHFLGRRIIFYSLIVGLTAAFVGGFFGEKQQAGKS